MITPHKALSESGAITVVSGPATAGRARWRGFHHHRSRRSYVAAVLGVVWLAVAVLPIYYLVIASLRSQSQYLSESPWIPSGRLTFANYTQALAGGMLTATQNSIIVTVLAACATVGLGFVGSYAIVRSRRHWLRATVFRLFLLGLAVPLEGSIIPLFIFLTREHLYNTLWGLILPLIAFQLPLTVVVLTSFLRDVPQELFEAMSLDGASEWRKLISLAAPMARPALLGIFVFVALRSWNSFLLPLVVIQSNSLSVVPLTVYRFETTYSANVPAMLASVIISTIPLLLLYVFGRRQLLRGLTIAVGR